MSPLAVFMVGNDGHGPEGDLARELGVGGAVLYPLGRYFELGAGVRYDYAYGTEMHGDTLHVVTAPATATLTIPVGAGSQLRFGVGVGPGFGWAPGFGPGGGALRMVGLGGELAIGYAQGIGEGVRIGVHVGARGEVLSETNAAPHTYQEGHSLVNIQLGFVRTGITWR